MQRRCQEVIDRCWALGGENPIVSIHDVGAGGLSNALPELVNDSKRGARFELRRIPSDEPGMSPLEIWCNEAQERYVLAIAPARFAAFERLAERERCPFAVVGEATDDGMLRLDDSVLERRAIDMPLGVLLGKPPKMTRTVAHAPPVLEPFEPVMVSPAATDGALAIDLGEAALRVLRLPTIADKTFLITIGDRTVGGLCARDQMVGPWQVPVADAALTTAGFDTARRRGDGDRRARAGRAARRRRVGAHGRRRSDHQPRVGAGRAPRRRQAVGELDGAPRVTPARTRASTTPCAPSGASSARRWASRSPSARTRCRCARSGRRPASRAA